MRALLPGLLAAVAIAAIAEGAAAALSRWVGIPPVVLALALGAALAHALGKPFRTLAAPGTQLLTKKVLKLAIVCLGLKLTLADARALGGSTLGLIAACLVLSLAVAALLGRPFGVSRRVGLLLGCGTAICGATAVMTIAPLVRAEDDEVAFSITTIFLFNVAALFAFPPLGHALGMGDLAFGAWVGTAVNDTSACVATGRAFSSGAETFAVAIKLIRTLALVPMALAVAAFSTPLRGDGPEGAPSGDPAVAKPSLIEVFPLFVLGFAAAAVLANVAPLPKTAVSATLQAAGYAITAVLAAVGLHIDARKIAGAGVRSLALGVAIALVMALASLTLVRALGL